MADPQIAFIVADLAKFTADRLVKLAIDIQANLVEACPVDIGWARAGFVPTFGRPYEGGSDLDPDPSKVSAARGVQAASIAAMSAYRLKDGPLFVANNVSYIIPLVNGHSLQAPRGWVPNAIERGIQQNL